MCWRSCALQELNRALKGSAAAKAAAAQPLAQPLPGHPSTASRQRASQALFTKVPAIPRWLPQHATHSASSCPS